MRGMGNQLKIPPYDKQASKSNYSIDLFFMELKNRIEPNTLSLKQHLRNFVFQNYNEEEQKKISEMLQGWRDFPLADLIKDDLNQKDIEYYKKIPMLSARVFLTIKKFFESVTYRKYQDYFNFEGIQKFFDFIRNNEITLSHNRYGFQKKAVKFRYSYESYETTSTNKQSIDYYLKIKEWAQKQNIQFITNLLSFLIRIGLLIGDESETTTNVFLLQLERITKQDQRQMFLKDISNLQFQQIQNGQITEDEAMKIYQNYYFYKNKKKARYDIGGLQSKMGDYHFLEVVHDYIQWMFPNHYGSAFNSSSVPLGYTEAYLFLRENDIGITLLRSIYIFFDFMGIRLNLQTLKLTICCRKRLEDVILVNFHNHLRIMRILACLSVTGFRRLALNLVDFLDVHTSSKGILSKERRQFQKSWEIYGQKYLQKAKRMCFLQTEDFPQDHEILKTTSIIQLNAGQQKTEKNQSTSNNMSYIADLDDFNKKEVVKKQEAQNDNQLIQEQQSVPMEQENITDPVITGKQVTQKSETLNHKPKETINNSAIIQEKPEINKQQFLKSEQGKDILIQIQKEPQPILQSSQVSPRIQVEENISQIDNQY